MFYVPLIPMVEKLKINTPEYYYGLSYIERFIEKIDRWRIKLLEDSLTVEKSLPENPNLYNLISQTMVSAPVCIEVLSVLESLSLILMDSRSIAISVACAIRHILIKNCQFDDLAIKKGLYKSSYSSYSSSIKKMAISGRLEDSPNLLKNKKLYHHWLKNYHKCIIHALKEYEIFLANLLYTISTIILKENHEKYIKALNLYSNTLKVLDSHSLSVDFINSDFKENVLNFESLKNKDNDRSLICCRNFFSEIKIPEDPIIYQGYILAKREKETPWERVFLRITHKNWIIIKGPKNGLAIFQEKFEPVAIERSAERPFSFVTLGIRVFFQADSNDEVNIWTNAFDKLLKEYKNVNKCDCKSHMNRVLSLNIKENSVNFIKKFFWTSKDEKPPMMLRSLWKKRNVSNYKILKEEKVSNDIKVSNPPINNVTLSYDIQLSLPYFNQQPLIYCIEKVTYLDGEEGRFHTIEVDAQTPRSFNGENFYVKIRYCFIEVSILETNLIINREVIFIKPTIFKSIIKNITIKSFNEFLKILKSQIYQETSEVSNFKKEPNNYLEFPINSTKVTTKFYFYFKRFSSLIIKISSSFDRFLKEFNLKKVPILLYPLLISLFFNFYFMLIFWKFLNHNS